jgi:hypothetical protein
MRKIATVLILLLCMRCASKAPPPQAVYWTKGQGELSSADLQAHPEVIVVQNFDELKNHASQKIALWIDKNATPLDVQQEIWLNQPPQAYYPIALIGSSDTSYSFHDLLQLRCFSGPVDHRGESIPMGFSIVQRKPSTNPSMTPIEVSFVHGYNQELTAQSILEITNNLLEGKFPSTPVSTLPATPFATSATPPVLLYDDWPCEGFPNDAAKITAATLKENILTIHVTYQGGCQEHDFALHAATAFLQSIPPQALLHLSHDAQGDTCKQNIQKQLSFDLTPLDPERDEPGGHPLLLRIYEPVSGSFAKEPIMPLLEWP